MFGCLAFFVCFGPQMGKNPNPKIHEKMRKNTVKCTASEKSMFRTEGTSFLKIQKSAGSQGTFFSNRQINIGFLIQRF